MKPRTHDPRRLDVAAFAAEGGTLSGRWPLDGLPRVVASELAPEAGAPESDGRQVEWSAEGERREVLGGSPEIWLTLRAQAVAHLQCQRCLGRVDMPLAVERRFRFVADETAAERLDGEIEDEVLVLERSLDLHELVEDELLLAMPLVPRHDACPDAPPMQFGEIDDPEAVDGDGEDGRGGRPNPFAALAALKKGGGSA